MGLGTFKNAWQWQMQYFGHQQKTKYTCLAFDNRGMGDSDKPLIRYSTSEMAKDTLELVDYLGWKSTRQLHVISVSMGGMIAQEFVSCTKSLKTVRSLGIPKSPDVQLNETKVRIFSKSWLDAPDEYNEFPTNGDRFAAMELKKRQNVEGFTRTGFICQAIAAGWHHKSPDQLKELADKVGRSRIQVLHGTLDKMITVPHGETLARELGEEKGVTKFIVQDRGHALHMEEKKWYHSVIEDLIGKVENS
ncbi:MAG: hypothetical protein Q9222_004098 [Ikaeria aurantiellina]